MDAIQDPVRRVGVRAIKVLSAVWFVFHFGLTLLYLMPVNPMTLPIRPQVSAMMGAMFYQNWGLFAPNPINTNDVVLVKPLRGVADAARSAGDGWYDLSTPLWRGFQQNRFGAYERLSRPIANAVRTLSASEGVDLASARACSKGDSLSCKGLTESAKTDQTRGKMLLGRIGSSFVNGMPDGEAYSHVAVRVRFQKVPAWSQRFAKVAPAAVDIDVGVFPVDRKIVPSGLYISTAAQHVAARGGRE